jgi:hypothetical protein
MLIIVPVDVAGLAGELEVLPRGARVQGMLSRALEDHLLDSA